MVYPLRGTAPIPNPDMPQNVKDVYLEATAIEALSPRAAAALLRLGVQLLCPHLGAERGTINEDIKYLVANGLPEKVQKALDIVRVVGNDAVHPGQIDTDDPATVATLFRLLNVIVERMLTEPKEIDTLYAELPEAKRKAIEDRDKDSK